MASVPIQSSEVVRASPGCWGHHLTEGKWQFARHLRYLDQIITSAVVRGGARLAVTMPPRHGKSVYISQYLPSWYLGTFPDKQVLIASYAANFAADWGRASRDLLEEYGTRYFGVSVRQDHRAADTWELVQGGKLRTAGVGGQITGRGADLLIIDDPIKNSVEAFSETTRRHQWEWFQSVATTRLHPNGSLIILQTRWHEDDLLGRVLRLSDSGEVDPFTTINLPALAESNDLLGRNPGEALWPERYPRETLLKTKATVGSYFWAALYQQRPAPVEGNLFTRADQILIYEQEVPPLVQTVRAWDLGGTTTGDPSSGIKFGRDSQDNVYILSVRRGRWTTTQRDEIIRASAIDDGHSTTVVLEQEPGSGGLAQVNYLRHLLMGYDVRVYKPSRLTGDKVTRAMPLVSYFGTGKVRIVRAPWNGEFCEELIAFPNAEHDDQVDAAAAAFSHLSIYAPLAFSPAGLERTPSVRPSVPFARNGGSVPLIRRK